MITTCLDGITLAMASNYELNLRRRDAMRPQFKSEFAKGLCSSTNPADEFLFGGGDTAKRIKEIEELNKNKVCKAQPSRPQGRGQRFSPYPQRGFRGYIRGRGRAFRGRGSGPSGYQQQQQYFQHAPQSEKKTGSRANQNWYVNYECDTVKAKISNQPPFKAGNTRNCIFEWQKLSSDPEVLDFVQHCHIEFTDSPCKYSTYGQRHFNSQQQLVIDSEVGKLLQLGVISQSVHEQEECLSPIFVVPKPDGSRRLILNFKSCNEAVLFRHFNMDTLSTVINLIRPGVYMASLDLKHAYYTIPIAAEHRKYLKFVWGGQLYEFQSLPMGLTSSLRQNFH